GSGADAERGEQARGSDLREDLHAVVAVLDLHHRAVGEPAVELRAPALRGPELEHAVDVLAGAEGPGTWRIGGEVRFRDRLRRRLPDAGPPQRVRADGLAQRGRA